MLGGVGRGEARLGAADLAGEGVALAALSLLELFLLCLEFLLQGFLPAEQLFEFMAVYHLKVGFGSRAGGQSAAAKSDYIERDGRYAKDLEELEHKEHGHMPAWAQDDPRAYWQAADEHEHANGRLYSEIQFALPRELDAGGRRELAGAFAERVCAGERLPYTLAIHRGGADGENPRAHCRAVVQALQREGP